MNVPAVAVSTEGPRTAGGARNLVCITTSQRAFAIKAFAGAYISFVDSSANFDLVVAIDGEDVDTENFCRDYGLPYIVSEKREGVGLSKNRVLKEFTGYSAYFFVEDDVELLDARVFDLHLEVSKELNLHHLSLGPRSRFLEEQSMQDSAFGAVRSYRYGSGAFNFFTGRGLDVVGGFHTEFAKYRRFGHTEHSYRFVNAGLAAQPFWVIDRCFEGYIQVMEPPSVTRIQVPKGAGRLSVYEQQIIEERLAFFPVTVISRYRKEGASPKKTKPPVGVMTWYRLYFVLRLFPFHIARKVRQMIAVPFRKWLR